MDALPGSDFSILALGRRLGAMREREHLLDVLGHQVGTEPIHAPLDRRRLAQRHAKKAHAATAANCDALEELILTSRAETLGDALVQAMVASSWLGLLAKDEEGQTRAKVDASLQGVVRVLARETGLSLAELGGRFYSSTWADPWPDVDVSAVTSDTRADVDCCIDGSTPAENLGRAAV